jgi:hypothetical protein
MWRIGYRTIVKVLVACGGPGVKPHGLQKVLINEPKAISQNRGATWQPFIGPRGTFSFDNKMPRIITLFDHHQPTRTFHVGCQGVPSCHVTATCDSYGLPSQHFFACFTFRSERDIFSIRTPFDIKIIPPESGRRGGQNGIGFIEF